VAATRRAANSRLVSDETDLLRRKVAEELGLPRADVTDAVLLRIAEDPSFAHHLELCKSDPDMRRIVLAEATSNSTSRTSQEQLSDAAVVARASAAVARWALAGFGRVSQREYRRRLAICGTCEHLTDPPDSVLYALMSRRARTICGLCGCDVRRKAWLKSEQCPDRDFGEGGRWPSTE
jgi:hypothetical protein